MYSKHISWTKTAALALLLGTLAQPAWAATVNIDKCQIISKPGSYKLTKNLTAAGTCFTITTDSVTLDLGGHVLTGNGTGYGVTDRNQFSSEQFGITVRNGAITKFERGIELPATKNAGDSI